MSNSDSHTLMILDGLVDMCYKDESLNRVISNIAASTHRMTFYEAGHKKFVYLEQLSGVKY